VSKIINLRTARKRASRAAERQAAAENAARHGTTKAERRRTAAEAAKATRDLDGHKREP
jgi:hypothetical protein